MILREANLADCKVFFEWVNDDSLRQSAIKKDLIEWKSHKEWFVKKLNCKTSYLFIAEKDHAKIGQVRFDCVNSVAKIDYSISSDYRGNGYGKAIVLKGIEKLIGESNKIKKFEAIVRVENIASRKIFLGLSFNEQTKTSTLVTYNFCL